VLRRPERAAALCLGVLAATSGSQAAPLQRTVTDCRASRALPLLACMRGRSVAQLRGWLEHWPVQVHLGDREPVRMLCGLS
jgi:hypothetical protein